MESTEKPKGISPEERRRMIEEAAYFRAERRGFGGGDAAEDWIAAEREIAELLGEETSGQKRKELAAYRWVREEVIRILRSAKRPVSANTIRQSVEKAARELKGLGEYSSDAVNKATDAIRREVASTVEKLGSTWETISERSADLFEVWRDRGKDFLDQASTSASEWLERGHFKERSVSMGKTVTFKRPDGKECTGYYEELSSIEKAPGVVVIQEWWGLNDQIKGVANRLAKAGYRTLVPDLYRGKVTLDAAEAAHFMGDLDFKDAATQDIRGAVEYLKLGTHKTGVIGFCMGGVLSVLAAVYVKETDAAVSWYGLPSEETADVSTIKIPLQGHFALKDPYFTPAQVDRLEAQLKKGQVPYEIYRYQADHAFGNETGERYDPEAARLAWQRTAEFLEKHLKKP